MRVRAVLVASANAAVGLPAARAVLEGNGSALDAVEVAVRAVEDDPADTSVGYGGLPNVLGDVELDASIMDGTTRRAGAVGALRGYRAAVSVARRVMETLPHAVVVGQGAARLASDMGLAREDLLTTSARETWQRGLDGQLQPGDHGKSQLRVNVAVLTADPEMSAGTVNVLARDRAGRVASAVSTSGWAWKWPGRLGDTPLIGAGNYCDDRYGAAACTGWGELAIRAVTAHTVVSQLARGRSPRRAGRRAIREVLELDTGGQRHIMSIVVLAADGTHAGFSTKRGRTYLHWTDGEPQVTQAARRRVRPGTHHPGAGS